MRGYKNLLQIKIYRNPWGIYYLKLNERGHIHNNGLLWLGYVNEKGKSKGETLLNSDYKKEHDRERGHLPNPHKNHK